MRLPAFGERWEKEIETGRRSVCKSQKKGKGRNKKAVVWRSELAARNSFKGPGSG